MSALPTRAIVPPVGVADDAAPPAPHGRAAPRDAALVLLGSGVVGTALLRLLATPAAGGLHLVGLANSRAQHANARGLVPAQAARLLDAA
ncbi:MAG TPA: hypothetical protein VI238_14350, partial [Dokdonella sp.]